MAAWAGSTLYQEGQNASHTSLSLPMPSHWRRNRPINVNHYANKKSAAESMLDIALLMANASQLKAVIEQGPSFAFFMPLVVLISISLVLQIGVGVLLIFLVGVRTRPGVGVRIARSLCTVLRGACSALCAFKPRPGRGHALRSLTRHWLLMRKQGLQGDGHRAASQVRPQQPCQARQAGFPQQPGHGPGVHHCSGEHLHHCLRCPEAWGRRSAPAVGAQMPPSHPAAAARPWEPPDP
ncbi:ninjurin-1 isoform X4 [Manis pentadactyla]|uniref:ninjurin-1 isoform X4 n=1 Tax=Manis pentadactyla TaxID=143292 RepID=UPI00255CA754|nr:ninjurin-1 isoform X4 [Manis pentadactyla]